MALSSWRLYSWRRLIWTSKMASGSISIPSRWAIQAAKSTLLACLISARRS